MRKFNIEPKQKARAVQWRGDNIEEVKEFLTSIPGIVDVNFSSIHANEWDSMLTLVGYRGIADVVYVTKGNWLVYLFSVMNDRCELTTLIPGLFDEHFIQTHATPSPDPAYHYSGDANGY